MALSRVANSVIKTETSFVFTANTTLDGTHAGITGNNLKVSSNSTFTGTTTFNNNITFANSAGTYTNPVLDFTSANTVGLAVAANWIIVNANRNLESGNNYFANTRNTLTLTLPTSAEIGDTIRIIDNEGFAAANNVTISRNGHLIQGQSANLTINTSRAALGLVYSTAGNGWLLLEN